VIPVSSLAATAQTAVDEGVDSALVALDARMSEVFTATFEVNNLGIMVPVTAERVCSPESVSIPVNSGTFGIGNGFDRYTPLGELSEHLMGIRPDIWPRASSMLKLAQHWLNSNEPLSAEQAQPVYLRDNVAKKEKDR
jgi:tRNA threonylcarbamoyladenosine biosynthesis protein TsaB